jgi:hypothetical protein
MLLAEMLTADSPWAHVKLDGWQVTASSFSFQNFKFKRDCPSDNFSRRQYG